MRPSLSGPIETGDDERLTGSTGRLKKIWMKKMYTFQIVDWYLKIFIDVTD